MKIDSSIVTENHPDLNRLPLESELKFVQESYAAQQTIRSLAKVCRPDQDFQQNRIHSVYYDTADWLFAMEKASSDYLKTKVRVRWYNSLENDSEPSPCFFEVKKKIGSKRDKTRHQLPGNSATIFDLLGSRTGILLIRDCLTRLAPELSGLCLEPKILVSYTRNRYYEPVSRTRVAFDTGIYGTRVDSGSFTNARKIKLEQSVLEVKGFQEEIPQVIRNINSINLKKATFSKYYECFLRLTNYQQ